MPALRNLATDRNGRVGLTESFATADSPVPPERVNDGKWGETGEFGDRSDCPGGREPRGR